MSRYFSPIKHYSWVILLCVVLASIIGFVITKALPSAYQVSSIVVVRSGAPGTVYPGGPTSTTDSLNQALSYNAQILTRSTMQAVIKANPELALHKYTADDLLLDIVPTVGITAPTITIVATGKTAADAVLIANAVATTFAGLVQTEAQQQLETQRKDLQSQLTAYQQQEGNLEAKLAATPTVDPHYPIYNTQLQNTIHNEQAVQGQLLLLPATAALKGNVFVVQSAQPTDAQPTAKATSIILVTAGIGLLLGILVMFLLIFLDNRLSSEEQVKEKLGLAYLGGISNDKDLQAGGASSSPVLLQEVSDICANLRLTGVLSGPWRTPQGAVLLVTSNQSAEGKTTVVAAIATVIAQTGSNVLVVDGNLREPSTHLAFGLAANFGLSELLRGTGRENLDDAVQRSKIPNVWLLSAGTAIATPASLLDQRLPGILAQLRKKVDVIVIDAPALLGGAEATVLASMSDGVALIVDTRVDKVRFLLRSRELLKSLTQAPSGVIMNRLAQRGHNPYYAVAHTKTAAPDKMMPSHNGHDTTNGWGGQAASTVISGSTSFAFIPAPTNRPLALSEGGMPQAPLSENSDKSQKLPPYGGSRRPDRGQ